MDLKLESDKNKHNPAANGRKQSALHDFGSVFCFSFYFYL